jgi:hypothetical protein
LRKEDGKKGVVSKDEKGGPDRRYGKGNDTCGSRWTGLTGLLLLIDKMGRGVKGG